MDLDPNDVGQAPSTGAVRLTNDSSTSSRSNQLEKAPVATQPRSAPPHHGAHGSDSPSTGFELPNQQQQHHRQQYIQAGDGAEHDSVTGNAKKSRACEACRALKVRCEPDPNDEGAPCKRCKKAGRSCVVTMPTRKRQKKTDSRVSELEKKIDALTASLQARAVAPSSGIGSANPVMPKHEKRSSSDDLSGLAVSSDWVKCWTGMDMSGSSSQTRGTTTSLQNQTQTQTQTPRPYQPSVFDPSETTTGIKRKGTPDQRVSSMKEGRQYSPVGGSMSQGPPPSGRGQRLDIIDRGIVSVEKATELFQRYREDMLRHLPSVVFPPDTSVTDLRKSKPYLFLAIMAAASSETHGLQKALQKELMELFAEKIIIVGEKNLELVQALHVAVIWYWPPEHFEELKFYQLVHMSAVMALEIGLGKRPAARRGGMAKGPGWREDPFRDQPQLDPTSLECRRAWLTCHFLASNTAMSLHRPHLIRWSSFMTESLELLRTSPDACPTDMYFSHLVWTHRMAENIGVQLSMDDADAGVNIADPRTQFTLRGLERDLERYIAAVPTEMMQPTLRMTLCILNIYMHELALHSDGETPAIQPPFAVAILQNSTSNSSEPLSAAHINALSTCLAAIDNTFQAFLAMDVFAIRCLPVFNFVRIGYAVVVLMKMYFSASSPSSELGKVINKDNMRVAYYLEALLDKFSATAADEKCRPASKFLLVLVMLRTWFLKHRKSNPKDPPPPSSCHNPTTTATTTDPTPSPAPRDADAYAPDPPAMANTPLQVLSEVAMGQESTPRPFYNPISTQPVGPPQFYTDPSISNPPQQWISQPPIADMTVGFPAGFDFEGLGVPLNGSGEMYGGGAKMVLNDPLFSDMIQGLPDPNFFSF